MELCNVVSPHPLDDLWCDPLWRAHKGGPAAAAVAIQAIHVQGRGCAIVPQQHAPIAIHKDVARLHIPAAKGGPRYVDLGLCKLGLHDRCLPDLGVHNLAGPSLYSPMACFASSCFA